MALTKVKVREILSTAGVDADHMSEAVNAIIDGHVASIDALREENGNLKAELKTANEKADKLDGVQKELDDLKKQNEDDAKAREGKDYDALKKEFDDYKEGQESILKTEKEQLDKDLKQIDADLAGPITITGRGAGKIETASAILSDLIAIMSMRL